MNVTELILALVFSFTCAVGFGICFGIRREELYLAGLAGVVTRIVLIICESFMLNRLFYTMIAALVGTIYAELVGMKKRVSIAKFLYPALVLLIPGDVLYEMIMAMIQVDQQGTMNHLVTLVQALMGIALGSMIGPMLFKNYRKEHRI